MSTDLLFEQFSTLATAPDGIARLRELILQLAVQGKLGTQDAGDEPASVILKQVINEKQKLFNNGKIRNITQSIPIQGNEVPFKLPKGWLWIRLDDCSPKITDGEHFRPITSEKGIKFLSAKDLKDKGVNFSDPLFVDESVADKCRKRCDPEKNDILVVSRGDVGKCCIVDTEEIFCLLGSVILIKTSPSFNSKYILYSLKSEVINKNLISISRSTAQAAIYIKDIRSVVLPLPPFAEQHRIVAKVDRLMALCDELDARQMQERAGCLKLGTSSLEGLQNTESPEEFGRQWAQVCDAFDMILDCPENVAVLRQTILQLAVQGRLVRQEPGDEPCRAILKKLQKNSEYSQIDSDEIPYSLPNGWEWERLGTLTKFIDYRGKTPNKILSGIKLITAKNVRMGYLNDEPREYISSEEYDTWMTRGFPSIGDLLFTTEAPMGNIAQISITEKFALAQRVINFHPYEGIFSSYLMYAIMSPFLQSCIYAKSSGVTARGIKASKLKLIPVPLPPLAEQHRIVAKVDALMALCDTLELRLKERARVQGRLAGAVVKQVGGVMNSA